MSEEDWDELIRGWIDSNEREKIDGWAIESIAMWHYDQPAMLWQFILDTYTRDISDRVLGMIAAGPLEDLLAYCGDDFIDDVEELARKDPKFNKLLGGVWQNAMSDDLWNRVQRARNSVW